MFEVNGLRYGPYPEEGSAEAGDERGKKKVATRVGEGCSKGKAVITATRKKQKVEVEVKVTTKKSGAMGASKGFVEELAETCAELREVMTSPDLRKTSSRMLKVTGGEWHKKDPIPVVSSKDYFTSRLARDFKIFPYGRNIGAVVTIVMEKDLQ